MIVTAAPSPLVDEPRVGGGGGGASPANWVIPLLWIMGVCVCVCVLPLFVGSSALCLLSEGQCVLLSEFCYSSFMGS